MNKKTLDLIAPVDQQEVKEELERINSIDEPIEVERKPIAEIKPTNMLSDIKSLL